VPRDLKLWSRQRAFGFITRHGAFCEDCLNPDFLRSKKWLSSAAAVAGEKTATATTVSDRVVPVP
jgi:hypothetical protein